MISAIDAVNPCNALRPAIGLIFPAAKKPASGIPPRSSEIVDASWSATPNIRRLAPVSPAHQIAHDRRSWQVGVGVLDEQLRREGVRFRQQQVQIMRAPVEPVTGEQPTRAGPHEIQLERLGGQAGGKAHRHRRLVPISLVQATFA
jgi:hypothetical protein